MNVFEYINYLHNKNKHVRQSLPTLPEEGGTAYVSPLKTEERKGVSVGWVVKERDPLSGVWVPVAETHNIVTNYGLTAFAGAPSGNYIAPVYLVIDSSYTTFSTGYSSGVSSVQIAANPTVAGDTQLTLGTGLASQEVITFTSITGSGPYTVAISGTTTQPHSSGDPVTRTPRGVDTITSVVTEVQFDPTFFANQRKLQTANYSPGLGQNTMQFFMSGLELTNVFLSHVGLSETVTVGQGNLHNWADLGYNHNNTNDIEVDVTWTITTS